MAPSHHGCCEIHSALSQPSATSKTYGTVAPVDRNLPRTSWATYAYPRPQKYSASYLMAVYRLDLSYGVRTKTAGNGPSPSGR